MIVVIGHESPDRARLKQLEYCSRVHPTAAYSLTKQEQGKLGCLNWAIYFCVSILSLMNI